MKLLFATTNPGKLRELRGLMGDALECVGLSDFPEAPSVEEDADTFEGNARKKALIYAQAFQLPTLADDSGLCVDALGGRPGVHSARYAATEEARIARLLAEMKDVPQEKRQAQFRCVLCLAWPSGRTVVEAGECAGEIALGPEGKGGFGYDPVFRIPSLLKTFAQLSEEEKSERSHRGLAFRKLRPVLVGLSRRR